MIKPNNRQHSWPQPLAVIVSFHSEKWLTNSLGRESDTRKCRILKMPVSKEQGKVAHPMQPRNCSCYDHKCSERGGWWVLQDTLSEGSPWASAMHETGEPVLCTSRRSHPHGIELRYRILSFCREFISSILKSLCLWWRAKPKEKESRRQAH